MKIETTRKLILTYRSTDGSRPPQNIEMKIPKTYFKTGDIPGRVFPPTDAEPEYDEYIKTICDTLNKEIEKLVDNAEFHIVEVKIIK